MLPPNIPGKAIHMRMLFLVRTTQQCEHRKKSYFRIESLLLISLRFYSLRYTSL